jgi:hypothetical protein
MIRQTFVEERMSRTRVFEWKSQNSLRPKKARKVKNKVKNILIIFFDTEGIVNKKISPEDQ